MDLRKKGILSPLLRAAVLLYCTYKCTYIYTSQKCQYYCFKLELWCRLVEFSMNLQMQNFPKRHKSCRGAAGRSPIPKLQTSLCSTNWIPTDIEKWHLSSGYHNKESSSAALLFLCGLGKSLLYQFSCRFIAVTCSEYLRGKWEINRFFFVKIPNQPSGVCEFWS